VAMTNKVLSLQARPTAAVRSAAPWMAGVGVALFAGALAAGKTDTLLGSKPTLLVLAALLGGSFLTIFAYLGSAALLVWPVATTGGYLLNAGSVFTFDRAWIGGLLAYVALTPRPVDRTQSTRLMRFALLLFLSTFFLRAITTSASNHGPLNRWIDAILLPTILFFACERYCLQRPDRVRRLAASLMIAGGVLGAIGVAEKLAGFELATLTPGGAVRFDAAVDTTRISGPYPAPEPYALTLIICFAATLYWILSRKPGSRFGWALPILGLEAGGIALALFRAGWIAAILVVITSFGLRPHRFGRLFAVAGVACVVGFFATAQLQQDKTVSNRLHNTGTIYSRLATYEDGLEIFRSAPLFGVGVDKYHQVAVKRPVVVIKGAASRKFPHNSYLGLLAEQGLVGFLPFLLLTFAAWYFISSLRRASFTNEGTAILMGTVAGAAVGYLIMSLTLTLLPYEPPNAFFAAFLGGAAGHLDALGRTARAASD
jgi:O-antigen ligase